MGYSKTAHIGSLALSMTLHLSTTAPFMEIVGCSGSCLVGVRNTDEPNNSPNLTYFQKTIKKLYYSYY